MNSSGNPFLNPIAGIITSIYSNRVNPILRINEFHDGIDIYAEEGTDVVAVARGIVTEVSYSETYGNFLRYRLVEYEKEIEIFYAHLDKVLVEVGDIVGSGDIVGKCGMTGLSTGPHLHYSIYIENSTVDPLGFVSLEMTEEVKNKLIGRSE